MQYGLKPTVPVFYPSRIDKSVTPGSVGRGAHRLLLPNSSPCEEVRPDAYLKRTQRLLSV